MQRKERRRPSRGLLYALLFILSAAVVFVGAVLLGERLRRLSELPPETGESTTVQPGPAPGRFNKDAVPYVIARASAFEEPGEAVITDAVQTGDAPAERPRNVGYNGVSVNLRSPLTETEETTADSAKVSSGMTVSFSSPSVAAHSYDAGDGPEPAPTVSALRTRYGYVSGVFTVSYTSGPETSRLIMREYELSLLAELAEAGFDDIILRGFDCGPGGLEEGVEFIRELKRRAPDSDTLYGLSLEFSFCESADARSRLNTIGFDCGFLAVDLTGEEVPTLMTAEEVIRDRVRRISELVDVYGIRVIVGCGDADGFDDEVFAAKSGGAMNVQALLPAGKNTLQ